MCAVSCIAWPAIVLPSALTVPCTSQPQPDSVLRELLPPPPGEPVLRYARSCIDSTTTTVSEEQLAAFKRVEELRYGIFMPPPA